MELSDDEKVFLREIEADLDDDTARLVYADWLEERGDERGEYLRLEFELISGAGTSEELSTVVERINQLNQTISPAWLALVSRTAIEGCHMHFLDTRKCVGRWRNLKKSDQPDIRTCHECSNAVHFCTDIRHAKWLVRRQNSRVAVESSLERSRDDINGPGVPQPTSEDIEKLQQRLATAEKMLSATFGNPQKRRRSLWQRIQNRGEE